MKSLLFLGLALIAAIALSEKTFANDGKNKNTQEVLVKLAPSAHDGLLLDFSSQGAKPERIFGNWIKLEVPKHQSKMIQTLRSHPDIEFVQPNFKLGLLTDYSIQDPLKKAALIKSLQKQGKLAEALGTANPYKDNPDFVFSPTNPRKGNDPDVAKQWGMNDIGAPNAWRKTRGSKDMIVAVIDTGVDYTHEDLVPNLWYNKGEIGKDAQGRDKSANGVDDDGNGYIDDVVGWDFAANDNKPYDLAVEPLQLLVGGGNPGHGTHCAGNVAAKGDNAIGISGVAPDVKIMSLRFITEKGQGTTEAAVKAIVYAVDNGAKVLSNSWGGEGNPNEPAQENKILIDAIEYAKSKGVLFVAAAGNGRKGAGYNMDTDANPVLPASYQIDNIISVAALDVNDNLGTFSNFGAKLVHLGAPGVKVYSTTVGSNYSDTVIDKYGIKAYWDGTSMATPHVAGAAALWWSLHPEASYADVKAALLNSTKKINSLANKTVTGGKLDLSQLVP